MKKNTGNWNEILSKNSRIVNGLILAIGIILILISIVIGLDKKIGIILISIGTSIVASSIVVYLSSAYLLKQNNIRELIEKWGINGIYRTRQEMNISCNEFLNENNDFLDIIAFGLRSFRDSKNEIIKNKVRKGMKIRIITIDPTSEFLKQREIDEKEVEGGIKNTIQQLIKWTNELKQEAKSENQIRLKFYNTLPLDFYFRLDKVIYIGPYLYGITSQQTISYEYIRNSQGFEYYSNYFEKLWNDNNFSKEVK